MVVAGMMMRPWIMQIRMAAVTSRILADDLELIARGGRCLDHFEHAFNLTHKHLHEKGAEIALARSVVFTTDPVAKKWLRHTGGG